MIRNELREYAIKYQKLGLSILPTKAKKLSAILWTDLKQTALTIPQINKLWESPISQKFEGLAIITGRISKNLEVIDVDCKYDQTGTLWNDLSIALKQALGDDIYSKLTLASTVNKGYHIYYFCTKISGSQRIARNKTGGDAIIETRGEGGYIMVSPSTGYEFIQNDLEFIPQITERERELIWDVCKTFDLSKEDPKPIQQPKIIQRVSPLIQGLSPIDDYKNQAGANEALDILTRHGWKEVGREGQNIKILRPGDTTSENSGSFHAEKNTLYLHTTNGHPFQTNKPYSPVEIFNILECGGDWGATTKELRRIGFGSEIMNSKNIDNIVLPITSINTINTINEGNQITLVITKESQSKDVLKVIETNSGSQKSIFIQDHEGEVITVFDYKLSLIFDKYHGAESVKDHDLFLSELISISEGLSPLHNDQYLKRLLNIPAIIEMGISEESLILATDKARSTKDKEIHREAVHNLLEATKTNLTVMDSKEVEALLEIGLEDVKIKGKESNLAKLLSPTTEEDIKESLQKKGDKLDSGILLSGDDDFKIQFPSRALSFFAAPSSHGKTTFLFNSALNILTSKPDSKIYFFTMEEEAEAIILKMLNAYIDRDLIENKYENQEFIENYFKTDDLEQIILEEKYDFIEKKQKFFNEFIDSGRLKVIYWEDTANELLDAINYINKNAEPTAIFIDYIQLLSLHSSHSKRFGSRQEEVKIICQDFQKLAIKTGLPIIFGAQFNRLANSILSLDYKNLREAADIEQIASLIVGFWNNNFKPSASLNDDNITLHHNLGRGTNTIYGEILKNRGGQIGKKGNFGFDGARRKIRPLDISGGDTQWDSYSDDKKATIKAINIQNKQGKATVESISKQLTAQRINPDIELIQSLLKPKSNKNEDNPIEIKLKKTKK